MKISNKPVQFYLIGKIYPFLLLIAVFQFLSSCRDGNDPVQEPDRYLVSATAMGELDKQQVIQKVNQIYPSLAAIVQNGVRLYRVVYKTVNVDGAEIEASGAVAVPIGEKSYPMISVQHGTIMDDASAPSSFTEGNDFMNFGSLVGALGYIAVFPDYIGYGASAAFPHPYEHRASLGSASLDMLRAVKEFLKKEQAQVWNKKLYISGYSEGGYATLSLQKMLEENAKGEFDLKASTCGAGAYNKTMFMKHLINNESSRKASNNRSYIWVLLSYNAIYRLDQPASYFFREPYAGQIEKEKQYVSIDKSFNELLRPDFVDRINNGSEKAFMDAVSDNDLIDWKPLTPTQLYHGTSDDLVFYFNSETAYQAMKAKGATQVELKTLPGKDHGTAIEQYLIGTLSFFSTKQ